MPYSVADEGGGTFECEIPYTSLLDHKPGRVDKDATVGEYLKHYAWNCFGVENAELCRRVREKKADLWVHITTSYYSYIVYIHWKEV